MFVMPKWMISNGAYIVENSNEDQPRDEKTDCSSREGEATDS